MRHRSNKCNMQFSHPAQAVSSTKVSTIEIRAAATAGAQAASLGACYRQAVGSRRRRCPPATDRLSVAGGQWSRARRSHQAALPPPVRRLSRGAMRGAASPPASSLESRAPTAHAAPAQTEIIMSVQPHLKQSFGCMLHLPQISVASRVQCAMNSSTNITRHNASK